MNNTSHKSQSDESEVVSNLILNFKDNSDWCIEFGAGDGVRDCNSHDLLMNRNYKGILIEPNKDRYEQLVENYAGNKNVFTRNSFVELSGMNSLDSILSEYRCVSSPDFMSIDVDGNDLSLWRSMKKFRPKIVCIEYNQTMPPWLEYEQTYDTSRNKGSSAHSLNLYAETIGYSLIHVTKTNLIFLDDSCNEPKMQKVNLIENFLKFHSLTVLSSTFDGEIILIGNQQNEIHGIDYKISKFQMLPVFLRVFPSNMNPVQKFCWRMYKFFIQPRRTIRQLKG